MRSLTIDRCAGFSSLMAASLGFGVPAAAQPAGSDPVAATMERLSISLPRSVAASDPVRRPLEELSRERCDQKAIENLGVALDKAGYRREAANRHVAYSVTCGGHA